MRRIDAALSVRDGRLFIENTACDELASRFGTPIYVVSEDQLRRNARSFQAAFSSRWPEGPARVLPSLKANYTLALRRVLTQEGMGCDTFGHAELTAALEAGVPPGSISVNGSGKSAALIDDAVGAGARITIDAERELPLVEAAARRLGTRALVRLRLRPDLSVLTEPTDFDPDGMPTSEATRSYKAGIPGDDVVELGRRALASDVIDLAGVHVHLPRHRAETGIYAGMIAAFVDLVASLSEAWDGWQPREIDLGGGFAVPRDPTGRLLPRLAERSREPAPSIDAYAEVVTTALREGLSRHGMRADGVALEVEPGRALYADAGIHLARVVNTKRESNPVPWRWVETDTTEMFLPDSLIEHNRWTVVSASRADDPPAGEADVVGISCGFDLMVPSVPLPEMRDGETLAFLDTGAYQDASATNFNALPRPATVLVHGADAEIVKRAETVHDVFARDVVPERLKEER
jgi:diaminopimelate decarboxylase